LYFLTIMTGFFPTAHPDELFYSLCARYSDRVQYSNKENIGLELFGARASSASVELPSHLDFFVAGLPHGHQLSINRIIDSHTLLPLYAPFIPAKRVELIRERMRTPNGLGIQNSASSTYTILRPVEWLRFCPLCMIEDQRRFGECYWHRTHQIFGVEVCPLHYVFLENSNVRIRNRRYRSKYVSACQALCPVEPRALDPSKPHDQVLIYLAQDFKRLLEQPIYDLDIPRLLDCYVSLLAGKGLFSPNGTIKESRLLEEFRQYYPEAILNIFKCNYISSKSHYWPSQVIKNLKRGTTTHPLRHLLLIHFLGLRVESFFAESRAIKPSLLSSKMSPFGKGPWPCLNPVCHHYHRNVIERCQIYQERSANPVATFQCTCGFTYSRKGSDASPQDRFRISYIRSYGITWKTMLRNLWADSSISLREIGRTLGIEHHTVKVQAMRLGLDFPREGPLSGSKIVQASPEVRQVYRKASLSKARQVETYRNRWLNALKDNPGVTRTALRKRHIPNVYYWLHRYDKEWLKAHQPLARKRSGSTVQIDWERRDTQIAEEVKLSAARLKNSPGRPVRVTVQAIRRDIAPKPLMQYKIYPTRFPLTIKALSEVVETRFDFAIRRLHWAADCLFCGDILPSRRQLILSAGMDSRVTSIPEIKQAIDDTLLLLQEPCTKSNVA
jgi:hypothetical protein